MSAFNFRKIVGRLDLDEKTAYVYLIYTTCQLPRFTRILIRTLPIAMGEMAKVFDRYSYGVHTVEGWSSENEFPRPCLPEENLPFVVTLFPFALDVYK